MIEDHIIKLADRIKEKSYTTGTGNFALAGSVVGFSSFGSYYQHHDNVFYAITDGTNYEVGSGIYVSGVQDELVRFPFRSSNSNNAVDFPQGLKEVYVTYPATHSVFGPSGLNSLSAPSRSGIAFWLGSNLIGHAESLVWDSENNRLGIHTYAPQHSIDIAGTSENSIVKSSGLIVGSSGIYFPPENNNDSSYVGGRQLTHYEQNRLDDYALSEGLISDLTGSNSVIALSGSVNQFILFKPQVAGTVFAGPPSGCSPPCSPGYPSFRTLVAEDIPNLSGLYTTFASLSSVSGILNNRIISFNSAANTSISNVSGILNNKIDTVSGALDSRINNVLLSSVIISNINEGILSPASGQVSSSVPFPIDATGSVLYYRPLNGNKISLYNGSAWELITFDTTAISGLSNNVVYDIFGYKNSLSLLSLEAVAWTNITTRSTQLASVNNIYVKSGDSTRKYLGSVFVQNNSFQDTLQNRHIWNMYNQRDKLVLNTTDGSSQTAWTYSSNTWRALSGTSYSISILNGLNSNTMLQLQASVLYFGDSSSTSYAIGISSESNTVPPNSNLSIGSLNGRSSIIGRILSLSAINQQLNAFLSERPQIGVSTYYPVERRYSGGVASLYGGTSADNFAGITGSWRC